MSTHSLAAKRFVADADRMAWHDRALYAVREKRDRMMETVPEWEELRQLSSEIKRHTLSRLGDYLLEFERNATANGIAVHWARDAAEMNDTVWRLVREHGGRNLIKSKSMLSEECGLAPFLAGQGIDAVESDLGERIMQLMHRPPSHIVLPAIHVRREEVGELFERELGTARGDSDPTYLTHEARKHLRGKFLTAFSTATAQQLFDRWSKLDKYLLVKYMDGNVKSEKADVLTFLDGDGGPAHFVDNGNGRNIPDKIQFPGYNEKWKRAVAKDNGEILRVVK